MDYAIETAGLTVRFPVRRGAPVLALDHVNLRVKFGQTVGFIGPNGAGKTTAIHVLLGFVPPTMGEARLFGEDVRRSIARRRIGYLPEHSETYRFLTGRELLRLTGKLFLMKGGRLEERVDEVLSIMDIEYAADRRIGSYSKGMQQRICLAQALVNDPDLVILDEPTGGLDPLGRMEIRRLISRLHDDGKTVFFSSHELSEVELICDDIVMLSNGRVVAEGKVSDQLEPGESLEQFFLRTASAGTPAGGKRP